MSLQQLPIRRQHAWSLDEEGERLSRAPSAPGSAVAWSARRAFLWGAACLGTVAVFFLSAFLFLMLTVPEATSYMG